MTNRHDELHRQEDIFEEFHEDEKDTSEPYIDDYEEETCNYCPACSGSGEGSYDGSICYTCKGSGHTSKVEKEGKYA